MKITFGDLYLIESLILFIGLFVSLILSFVYENQIKTMFRYEGMEQNHLKNKSSNWNSSVFELMERCIECGGTIVTNGFEQTCTECGLVCSDFALDCTMPPVNHQNKNGPSVFHSIGKQINYASEQGSDIGYNNRSIMRDIKNQPLHPEVQKKFKRLIKYYDRPTKTKFNETEARILSILNRVSCYLQLNKHVVEDAAYFYKKILKSEIKVKNNVCVLALCIFMCSRSETNKDPIGINDISEVFNQLGHHITPRLILRSRVHYGKYFNLDLAPINPNRFIPKLIESLLENREFIEKFKKESCNAIEEYRLELMKMIEYIISKLPSRLYIGRNPIILASALIYAADRLIARKYGNRVILTQKMVSDSANVAEYSLRDHFVKIIKPIFLRSSFIP